MSLNYAQLEGLWINAGGSQALAPLMAAIALAESNGNPTAQNATDNGGTQTSWGLWQISLGNHNPPSPNWSDPLTNAKLAVAKYNSQGLTAWGTYDSGAYKAFLNSSTSPDLSAGANGSTTTAPPDTSSTNLTGANLPGNSSNCLWSVNFGSLIPGAAGAQGVLNSIGGIVGIGNSVSGSGSVGNICLISKSQARAVISAGILLGGLVLFYVGAGWLLQITTGIPGKVVGTATKITAPEAAAAGAAAGSVNRPPAKRAGTRPGPVNRKSGRKPPPAKSTPNEKPSTTTAPARPRTGGRTSQGNTRSSVGD